MRLSRLFYPIATLSLLLAACTAEPDPVEEVSWLVGTMWRQTDELLSDGRWGTLSPSDTDPTYEFLSDGNFNKSTFGGLDYQFSGTWSFSDDELILYLVYTDSGLSNKDFDIIVLNKYILEIARRGSDSPEAGKYQSVWRE